jgi:GH25 family lysozyme M1 (1,4-beta-N-acetylmuramidase)
VPNWFQDLFQALTARSGTRFQAGVDVAVYQGPPADWRSEAGKITWAGVKLTELEPGGVRYVNPDAADDWRWLRANKKGRIAYLFGHPSTGPVDSVAFFTSELRKLGLEDHDAVALDLETSDGLTPQQVDAWAVTVMEQLHRRLHRMPLLYTFISFAEQGNCNSLGKYPLWLADPSNPRGKPAVPAPWKTWAIQQYVITGPIDRDVANYRTMAEMHRHLGRVKEPQEMINLGGSINGPVASARWNDGVSVVAGLGKDGHIQTARFDGSKWSDWSNVNDDQAAGGPAIVTFETGSGHLYYTLTSGEVIELTTTDGGRTWS